MDKPYSLDRYRELSLKRLNGTITPQEAEELAQWLHEDDGEMLEVPASFAKSRAAQESRMLQHIEARTTRVVSMRKRLLYISSAAAIVLMVLTAGYLFLRPSRKASGSFAQRHDPPNDRLPASNKAILTLGDGKQVILDSTVQGALDGQVEQTSIKLDSGHLKYNTLQQAALAVQYNTLTTPRGGQFRLSLPDGSEVWLNAASSLRYPTAFTGTDRVVELTGQAYFEVAKNARQPFKVRTGQTEVEVLGTHFDVMAYTDEHTINTTLVEGSVQVRDGHQQQLLHPRQQAQVNSRKSTMVVQEVNIDKVIAWKNDLFIFNNADFDMILREISRWYDVEFVNLAGDKEEYGGSISRKKNLSDVLKLLSVYGHHQYKIEGKKVTILP